MATVTWAGLTQPGVTRKVKMIFRGYFWKIRPELKKWDRIQVCKLIVRRLSTPGIDAEAWQFVKGPEVA
jgi:hypothetical protein